MKMSDMRVEDVEVYNEEGNKGQLGDLITAATERRELCWKDDGQAIITLRITER